VNLLALGPFVEVIGAKVLVEGSILQHVIGSRQDRSGDGTNRLFCPAPGSAAMKLGLEIAGFLAGGGPGALDQGGLEPRRSPRLREGRLLRIRVERRVPWAFSPRA